jgi:hypothetical protein
MAKPCHELRSVFQDIRAAVSVREECEAGDRGLVVFVPSRNANVPLFGAEHRAENLF